MTSLRAGPELQASITCGGESSDEGRAQRGPEPLPGLTVPLPSLVHRRGDAEEGGWPAPDPPLSYQPFQGFCRSSPCSAESGLTEARCALPPLSAYIKGDSGAPGVWIISVQLSAASLVPCTAGRWLTTLPPITKAPHRSEFTMKTTYLCPSRKELSDKRKDS